MSRCPRPSQLHPAPADNDAWIGRFKALQAWVESSGQLPANSDRGGPGDTLRTWLERQRAAVREGELEPNLQRILETVPGALEPDPVPVQLRPVSPIRPARTSVRLERLEAFCRGHGRLPVSGGTLPGEKNLYCYLVGVVRPQHRRQELHPEVAARLALIPGALPETSSPEPDVSAPTARARRLSLVDTRLDDLADFCEDHGRLPNSRNPAPEPALFSYLYKAVRPAYAAGRLDPAAARRLEQAMPGCLVPRAYRRGRAEAAAA